MLTCIYTMLAFSTLYAPGPELCAYVVEGLGCAYVVEELGAVVYACRAYF